MRSFGRNMAATAVFLAMLLCAFSLWTLIPLGWVYIASKLSHSQFPSIGPYMVVIVGIILTVMADAWMIGRLNDLYVRVTGSNRIVQSRPSWLKSMRDTGPGAGLGDRRRGGDDVLGDARRASPSSPGSSSSPDPRFRTTDARLSNGSRRL